MTIVEAIERARKKVKDYLILINVDTSISIINNIWEEDLAPFARKEWCADIKYEDGQWWQYRRGEGHKLFIHSCDKFCSI